MGASTSVAGLLPVLVGRNFTLTVQLLPGASEDGQVFVCRYCVGFVPPNEMLDTENGRATDVLELRTVTVLAVAVVVFTVWLPKLRLETFLVNVGVPEVVVAAPDSVTPIASRPSPGVTSIVPELLPPATGANFTVMVQKLPAATEVPQVFVCVNAVDPEIVMPVMVSGAVPMLFTVTDSVELVPLAMEPKLSESVESV